MSLDIHIATTHISTNLQKAEKVKSIYQIKVYIRN